MSAGLQQRPLAPLSREKKDWGWTTSRVRLRSHHQCNSPMPTHAVLARRSFRLSLLDRVTFVFLASLPSVHLTACCSRPLPSAVPRTAPLAAEMSPSVPFLTAPKYYPSKMVGDVGFDPFGLSEFFDLDVMREAELKHGRVAMLAVLGVLAQEFIHLPGELYSNPNPVAAASQVGAQPLAQIVLFGGFVEYGLYNGKMTYQEIMEDKSRTPGDFGFDPMGLMAEGDPNQYALKEITHCRLAMIAIGGMLHQSFITGAGVFGHSA